MLSVPGFITVPSVPLKAAGAAPATGGSAAGSADGLAKLPGPGGPKKSQFAEDLQWALANPTPPPAPAVHAAPPSKPETSSHSESGAGGRGEARPSAVRDQQTPNQTGGAADSPSPPASPAPSPDSAAPPQGPDGTPPTPGGFSEAMLAAEKATATGLTPVSGAVENAAVPNTAAAAPVNTALPLNAAAGGAKQPLPAPGAGGQAPAQANAANARGALPPPEAAGSSLSQSLGGLRGLLDSAGTVAVDLVNHADKSGRADQSEFSKLKENSTSSGPDAVNSHAGATATSATAIAENPKSEAAVADQIAGSIVARSELVQREGSTEFHLRLEPPELGSVHIHLTATEQGISARILVHEASARQLIQSQLESLRQRLQDGGIALGQFDVTGRGGGEAGSRQGRHGSSGRHRPPASLAPAPVAAPAAVARSWGVRAVDVVV